MNKLSSQIPIGRIAQPEEIANAFAFLASDEASCINGTTLAADDGFLSFKYPLISK